MKKILVLCLLALVVAAPAHAQTKLFQATPMIKAATENNFEDMRSLLLKGSSANTTDGNGKTALMYAANAGNADMVQLLLENKGNPNQPDKNGNGPLFWAAGQSDVTVVDLLLKAGAKID